MAVALVGVAGTIVGVVLGWLLSRITAREVAREERKWQEEQLLRERQEAAASELRAAVIEVQEIAPRISMSPKEAAEPLAKARMMVQGAWTRASVLRDEGIDERFYALDMALFIAYQDTTATRETINFWPLNIALVDLRKALDAYLRRESQPMPEFPTSPEQIEIAGSSGVGIEKIGRGTRRRISARRRE
jgi:hypothetical protein